MENNEYLCEVITTNKCLEMDTDISPKIQSLIGIAPSFSQEEIESDERLKHILNH